jgi:uncharacterized phiE125 gp8 family phage protein
VIYDWTLKTAPAFEPVSLDEAKEHLRVSTDDENGSILAYLMAARQWVEAYTERSLATQTWQMSLSALSPQVWLPRSSPIGSVTHVKYYDEDNALQTWSSSNYRVVSFTEPALLEVTSDATWPSTYCRSDAVQIEWISGYATGVCPESLRLAVLTLTAHFYENREAVLVGTSSKAVEFAVEALCAPYRVFWRPPCQ